MGLFSSIGDAVSGAWDGVKDAATAVGDFAKDNAGKIAGTTGTVIGGALGGPAGAGIGGALGGQLGSSISGGGGSPSGLRTTGIRPPSNRNPISQPSPSWTGARNTGRPSTTQQSPPIQQTRGRRDSGFYGSVGYDEDHGFSGRVGYGDDQQQERDRRMDNAKAAGSALAKWLPLGAVGGFLVYLGLRS